MKIVFVSNYLNHHQLPVSDILGSHPCVEYFFVSTTEVPSFRKELGYLDYASKPYNVLAYRSEEERMKAQALVDEADVVVIGAAPYSWVEKRVAGGRLVFIYSERWFKSVPRSYFSLGLWMLLFKYHFRWSRKTNVSVLCSSAFLPRDLDLFGLYKGRRYKWGYITECPKLDLKSVLSARDRECIDIFWCARFIPLKKWELPILMASHLKATGYRFRLRMVGTGADWEKAKHLVETLGVEDCVELVGNFPNSVILNMMRGSSIFLFTSNREEGWGAVLNEAMGAGCACVVGDEIGSAPYLIRDGKNGFLFKSCSLDDLTKKVCRLLDDTALRERISVSAYETMQNEWSPQVAAVRIIGLVNKESFENGPGSLI